MTTRQTSLEEAYRRCEQMARASNFYQGLRLLPGPKRRAMMAIYAFMRQSDDISDEKLPPAEKAEQFVQWRKLFAEALAGAHTDHPTLPALVDAIRAFQIPQQLFLQLIDGTEMDLTAQRYATFEELYPYCFHVASVVGLICLYVFQFEDPKAPELAEACGIAFQLTNILRDIKEDLDRGRVYLPQDDLARFNCSEQDLRQGRGGQPFLKLLAFEIARARSYYEKARPLRNLIHRDSRPCFWAMYRRYESLLDAVEKAGPAILNKRVSLSSRKKICVLLEALFAR